MNEEELKEILKELREQGWNPLLCDTPVPFYDTAVRCGQPMEVYAKRRMTQMRLINGNTPSDPLIDENG